MIRMKIMCTNYKIKKHSPYHERNGFPWKAIELLSNGPGQLERLEIIKCGRQTIGKQLHQLASIFKPLHTTQTKCQCKLSVEIFKSLGC